jgi:hypothetical protein
VERALMWGLGVSFGMEKKREREREKGQGSGVGAVGQEIKGRIRT